MKRLLILLMLTPFLGFAQQKGIRFENDLSWAQIKAKAKAENKFIFVDCFTTWCGPCKYMSNTVFPQEVMGNYFNDKFINVQVQMDKTDKDNDYVKSWYEDAASIEKEHQIRAYPTFLYFSPDGKIVHRVVGGGEAEEFIARSSKALNPETQYYTLLAKYKEGNNTPEDLRKAALAAKDAGDMQNGSTIFNEYLATQSNLYTKTNIELLYSFTSSSKDKGFPIFLNESKKADAVLGEGKAMERVKYIVSNEEIYSKMFARDATGDWAPVEASMKQKYPKLADELLAQTKAQYYMYKKDWPNFQTQVVAYMKKYGQKASPEELNQFAWTVFENCPDMSCVKEALEWSKRSLEGKENPMFMDTYANILYRLGRKDEAIAMQEKAVKLSNGDKDLTATLDKMKAGEKTWK